MVRLYIPYFFALLFLVVPEDSAGQQGDLAGLTEVRIEVFAFDKSDKELGLDSDDIKNHVFVLLRSKLPRLVVNESAAAGVYIRITLGIGETSSRKKTDYFGSVQLMVRRPVSILKTGMKSSAYVWETLSIMTGPMNHAVSQTRETLELHLIKFAADWYRDNPSK